MSSTAAKPLLLLASTRNCSNAPVPVCASERSVDGVPGLGLWANVGRLWGWMGYLVRVQWPW